jgi:predicted ATPase
MITSIHYKNFKALQDATLSLGRFTLIVGANGTGKSTAVRAMELASSPGRKSWINVASKNAILTQKNVEVEFWNPNQKLSHIIFEPHSDGRFLELVNGASEVFSDNLKVYDFDSTKVASPVPIQANTILEENGRGLAGVLDRLRDSEPERFEELNRELNRWFYEFNRILFEVPADGQKSFLLRTTIGHTIKASELSDGTLLALAYLTIAYLPNPPKIVAFEEPEKGIHPRLLRNVQEAMYRLAFPENFGEKREPIQVIATTHSPYLLDLFKDNPEEVVISSKDENGVHFERLIDKPHIEEILQDAPLGEIWYSGVLGGVPAQI